MEIKNLFVKYFFCVILLASSGWASAVNLNGTSVVNSIENTARRVSSIQDYKLPVDAKKILITYNSKRKSPGDFQTLDGPGGPVTPSEGDTITYTYTSGGYNISETWTYHCDNSGCSWFMTERTQKLATELQ